MADLSNVKVKDQVQLASFAVNAIKKCKCPFSLRDRVFQSNDWLIKWLIKYKLPDTRFDDCDQIRDQKHDTQYTFMESYVSTNNYMGR